MSAQIHIVARIVAQSDKVEQVKEILLGLVDLTRKEEGCVSYQLLENKNDPTDFTFVEVWASQQAINAHFATSYVQNALAKVPSLVAKAPDIQYYSLLK
ncbi:MAG: antibiotic biosynthesis monooxygenase [Acidobacteria bacterium]|nr:antibiotic biosynthesis monooxygenase [Acidobacteriota bacterium]